MDYLPPELVEEIASYLNYEDVVACSRVSLQWEEAFNLDRVWKRFITFDIHYFEKQSSKMNYSLSSSQCQVEPCQTKGLVLKELFIRQNFASGKFHTEEINIGASYLDCIKETVDRTGNHWLFASLFDGCVFISEHIIQVWNLNDRPVLHSQSVTPLGELRRPFNTQMKVIGDRLFYTSENHVVVYKFAHPQYELNFLYNIEISKSRFPGQVFMSVKMICLPDNIVGFVFTNFHIHQHLHPSYEVWSHDGTSVSNNFEQLLFVQNVGFTSFPNVLIKKSDQNNVIVIYDYYDTNQYTFVLKVFDCRTLDYTDVTVVKTGSLKNFDVLGNAVVLIYSVRGPNSSVEQKYIECFSIENGSSLYCSNLDSETHHGAGLKKMQLVMNGDLIAIYKNVLSVYRLSDTDLNHVLSFELTKGDSTVSAVRNNFIIISYVDKDIYYELYNYKSGEKMFRIKLPVRALNFSFKKKNSFPANLVAYMAPDIVYGQQISANSIFIISFW